MAISENPSISGAESVGVVRYLMSIEKARFRRPVVPGDQLRLEMEVLRLRASHSKLAGRAWVGDDLAVEAVVSSAMVDR